MRWRACDVCASSCIFSLRFTHPLTRAEGGAAAVGTATALTHTHTQHGRDHSGLRTSLLVTRSCARAEAGRKLEAHGVRGVREGRLEGVAQALLAAISPAQLQVALGLGPRTDSPQQVCWGFLGWSTWTARDHNPYMPVNSAMLHVILLWCKDEEPRTLLVG